MHDQNGIKRSLQLSSFFDLYYTTVILGTPMIKLKLILYLVN